MIKDKVTVVGLSVIAVPVLIRFHDVIISDVISPPPVPIYDNGNVNDINNNENYNDKASE